MYQLHKQPEMKSSTNSQPPKFSWSFWNVWEYRIMKMTVLYTFRPAAKNTAFVSEWINTRYERLHDLWRFVNAAWMSRNSVLDNLQQTSVCDSWTRKCMYFEIHFISECDSFSRGAGRGQRLEWKPLFIASRRGTHKIIRVILAFCGIRLPFINQAKQSSEPSVNRIA